MMMKRRLSNRGLEGVIPPSFSDLKRLYNLNLEGNKISGPLPDLEGFDIIEQIDLSNNSLTGTIPESYGNLPSLKYM